MAPWQYSLFGRRPSFLRVMSLITAFLCISVTGLIESFAAYAPTLKKMYNYSQAEVDLLAWSGYFGLFFGYPCGFFMDKIGHTGTLTLALVIASVGSILTWVTTLSASYFSDRIGAFAIIFFLFGFGAMFSHVVPISVNMESFTAKHRAKIVGLLTSANSGGVSLMTMIYYLFYDNPKNPVAGNLSGYFFCGAILMIISSILLVLFTGVFPSEAAIEEKLKEEIEKNLWRKNEDKDERPSRIPSFLYSLDFYLIMFGFGLLDAVLATFRANITFYLLSFDQVEMAALVNTIQPFVCIVSMWILCAISDALIGYLPRAFLLCVTSVIQAIAGLLSIYYISDMRFFYFLLFMILVNDGLLAFMTPTLLTEYFGEENFTRSYGLSMVFMGVCNLASLEIFGTFYDMESEKQPENEDLCFGAICYRWIDIYMFGTYVITSLIYIALFWRAVNRKNDYEKRPLLNETHTASYNRDDYKETVRLGELE